MIVVTSFWFRLILFKKMCGKSYNSSAVRSILYPWPYSILYIDNPYVLYINLYTGIRIYAITPSYTAITILLDTLFSLSISYMVVVKQIAPVGFPTGACLLKRFSNLISSVSSITIRIV